LALAAREVCDVPQELFEADVAVPRLAEYQLLLGEDGSGRAAEWHYPDLHSGTV